MCLLDDVHLIEGENWPCPLSVCLNARAYGQQVMNSAILEKLLFIGHGAMIGSHRWQKTCGKIIVLSQVGETRFEEYDCLCPYRTSSC